jgi:hypothetical protein
MSLDVFSAEALPNGPWSRRFGRLHRSSQLSVEGDKLKVCCPESHSRIAIDKRNRTNSLMLKGPAVPSHKTNSNSLFAQSRIPCKRPQTSSNKVCIHLPNPHIQLSNFQTLSSSSSSEDINEDYLQVSRFHCESSQKPTENPSKKLKKTFSTPTKVYRNRFETLKSSIQGVFKEHKFASIPPFSSKPSNKGRLLKGPPPLTSPSPLPITLHNLKLSPSSYP